MCKIYRLGRERQACLIPTLLIALVCPGAFAEELSITPASMPRIGTVDERFQSYNVEMIEVTGGRFWKPYGSSTSDGHSDLYEHRAPIDLTRPRLRRLAAALAPAYDAAEYGRDFKVFHSFVKENFPEIMVLGPGTVGKTASASDLLAASGPGGVDVLSYHHYETLSERCGTTSVPETAL